MHSEELATETDVRIVENIFQIYNTVIVIVPLINLLISQLKMLNKLGINAVTFKKCVPKTFC